MAIRLPASGSPNPFVYDYDPRFGGKYTVPIPETAATTATATLGANQDMFPELTDFGAGVNAYNQDEWLNQQYAGFGGQQGYDQALDLINQNNQALLSGQMTPGQMAELTTRAAERGIATGTTGSANQDAALLARVLGKTEQMQQQGQQNFGARQGLLSQIMPKPFDVTSQFLNYGQARDGVLDQAAAEGFNRQIASSPVPAQAAAAAKQAAMGSGMGANIGRSGLPTWGGVGSSNAWGGVGQSSSLGASPYVPVTPPQSGAQFISGAGTNPQPWGLGAQPAAAEQWNPYGYGAGAPGVPAGAPNDNAQGLFDAQGNTIYPLNPMMSAAQEYYS